MWKYHTGYERISPDLTYVRTYSMRASEDRDNGRGRRLGVSKKGRLEVGRPYALLRVGFTYDRTLGMRRLTNTPVDLAVGKDGDLHILCRGGVSFIRRLSQDDEDLGAINLAAGGAAQIGGTYSVNSKFVWPISMQMDSDENLWISDEGANLITDNRPAGRDTGSVGQNRLRRGRIQPSVRHRARPGRKRVRLRHA